MTESTPDPIIEKLALLTRALGHPVSAKALMAQSLRSESGRLNLSSLKEVLASHGFENRLNKRSLLSLRPEMTPLVLLTTGGDAVVVTEISGERVGDRRYTLIDEDGAFEVVPHTRMREHYLGYAWHVKRPARRDQRSDLPEYTMEKAWFWKVIWRFRPYYMQVIVATVLTNFLALVGSLYVMNVYDRVIPNRAYETLWVLSIGVILANSFEFVARVLRARLTDIAGKKADLIISAALFRRVLAIDLANRPTSSGSYASNLREFESVRDFMTSASLMTLVDLPFVLLFVLVIYLVAGPLAFIPLMTIPIVSIAGLLVQRPLARYTNEAMREGSQRQGLAVEAIEGVETLKANNATSWAQSRWERFTAATAASSIKQKNLSNAVVFFAAFVQQLNTVMVVLWGTHLIHSADPEVRITMGALIATVILSGRALAPLSQVAGLMIRFQQARMAMQGLEAVIARKTEREPDRSYISLNRSTGALRFENTSFLYAPETPKALNGIDLTISPGERIGVLGAIGSGKSTLLRMAAGLYQPSEGNVMLDDIDLRQIDPADVRSHVSLLPQHPRLFLGSLRENLEMGRTDRLASDEDLVAALARFGLVRLVRSHPHGLERMLGEDGQGLSGGQRQLVALARLSLRNPRVVLLDEPTSGLDPGSEVNALNALGNWVQNRTLLLVTHRLNALALVNRVIVCDQGRVVLDGPRDQVLEMLRQRSMAVEERESPAETPAEQRELPQ